jgi:hypothetical protein
MMTRRHENLVIAIITKETKLYKHTRRRLAQIPPTPVPEGHRRRQRSGENDDGEKIVPEVAPCEL